MVNSPGGTRRRRSRIPSEEDDQLINFLVTGSQDSKTPDNKNLSVGNLVAESQQNYGSLDRGLMRRSRLVPSTTSLLHKMPFQQFCRLKSCIIALISLIYNMKEINHIISILYLYQL